MPDCNEQFAGCVAEITTNKDSRKSQTIPPTSVEGCCTGGRTEDSQSDRKLLEHCVDGMHVQDLPLAQDHMCDNNLPLVEDISVEEAGVRPATSLNSAPLLPTTPQEVKAESIKLRTMTSVSTDARCRVDKMKNTAADSIVTSKIATNTPIDARWRGGTMEESASDHANKSSSGTNSSDTRVVFDQILDFDFDDRKLKVGDVFFDGDNGADSSIDSYTLGWVEVVTKCGSNTYLSPVYGPSIPLVPKHFREMPKAAVVEMFKPDLKTRSGLYLQKRLRGRFCWQWSTSLAGKAAALHRCKVRGVRVMQSYNVHGFSNGKRHALTCHKYKDTYKAKFCRLGFGRSVFPLTDVRQVVKVGGKQPGDDVESDCDDVASSEGTSQSGEDDETSCEYDISFSGGDDCSSSESSRLGEDDDLDCEDESSPASDDGYSSTGYSQTDLSHGPQKRKPDDDAMSYSHGCKRMKPISNNDTNTVKNDDYFEVEALPMPNSPPEGDKKDKRVLCIDLFRKCGSHDTHLRVDQKRVLNGIIQTFARASLQQAEVIVERIFGFLDEDSHTYEDQYLCETSLFMAALLGCNTNVSALGGSVQALNAFLYLVGYLTKNPVTPNIFRTCVAAALKSAKRYESVAEDKNTASRNAKFVLQKVLNYLNAFAEMSDTQLSMLLLGFSSYKCSHRFAFYFPTPALEAQAAILKSRTDTGTEDAKRKENDSEESQDMDIEISDNDNDEDIEAIPSVPSRGKIVFRTNDNTAVALSQDELYRHRVCDWDAELPNAFGMSDLAWWCVVGRGCNDPSWRAYQRQKGLHDFNSVEYVRHIEVVEMPEQLPTNGPCQYYFFADDCPIKDSHIQKLHPKHRIAAYSGKPPRLPGKRPRKTRAESKKKFEKRLWTWRMNANLYGSTMGAILVPWDKDGDCNVHSYEEFQVVLNYDC